MTGSNVWWILPSNIWKDHLYYNIFTKIDKEKRVSMQDDEKQFVEMEDKDDKNVDLYKADRENQSNYPKKSCHTNRRCSCTKNFCFTVFGEHEILRLKNDGVASGGKHHVFLRQYRTEKSARYRQV